MKTNKVAVAGILLFVVAAFALGVSLYRKHVHSAQDQTVSAEQTRLVRMHSPILGPQGAPVTIVEFFDPACETCRAFYPIVKSLMAKYPEDVRLVIRYAPFHRGSDQVVKLLEAARRLAEQAASGALRPSEIDEERFARELQLADLPDPDLFIRTGGDHRISNFLLWNIAYAELFFTDTLWPDFGVAQLAEAIEDFSQRERRFGLTGKQVRG